MYLQVVDKVAAFARHWFRVKKALLHSAVAAGIVTGPDDGRWAELSVKKVAKGIVDSEMALSCSVSDANVRKVLPLAQRLADGEREAGTLLAEQIEEVFNAHPLTAPSVKT